MLRRIHVSQIKLGMFLHEVDASWMEHPFWRRRFLIEDHETIERLRRCGAPSVVIDESRGRKADALVAVRQPAPAEPPPRRPPPAPSPRSAGESFARSTVREAQKAIRFLFADARMGCAVRRSAITPIVSQIGKSIERDPQMLIDLTRIKSADESTFLHSLAVSALMIRFARHLDLDGETIGELGIAGLLHDIGKVSIPAAILNKRGRLTEAEIAVVQTHPERGVDLLKRQGDMSDTTLAVCLGHHERLDGAGYPDKRQAGAIGLETRIASICDVYDAVTSVRPYKRAWTPEQALGGMRGWTGQFDPELLESFTGMLGFVPGDPPSTSADEVSTDN